MEARRALTRPLLRVLIAGAAAACSDPEPGRDADEPRWLARRPLLADRSAWSMDVDHAARPRVQALGPIGVGNGRVFGMLGNQYPLAAWHNLGGPTYHKATRWQSDQVPVLLVGGVERAPTHERLRYVRRAPVAIVEARDAELDWTSVHLAPRGAVPRAAEDALVTVWIVRNRSPRTAGDVALEIRGTLARYADGRLEESDWAGRRLTVVPLEVEGQPGAGPADLRVPLGDLAPGAERVVTLVHAFVDGTGDAAPIVEAVRAAGPDTLLEATLAWWHAWFARAASVETPDPRFADLWDAQLLAIATNVAATGALSQMSQYSYTWLRDTHGPALLFPRVGLVDDLRTMLDYGYGAAILNGDLQNALRADLDLADLPPPPPWRSLGPFSGYTRAEGPSFLVLEYEQLYRATGDLAPLRERFDYLWHALDGQQRIDGCLQPYSGDETFEDVKQATFGENALLEPTDEVLSSYSSFVMIRAAGFLAETADALGRADDAAALRDLRERFVTCLNDVFWLEDRGHFAIQADAATRVADGRPFEDVSTMPLWLDPSAADEPRAARNFESILARLGRPNGTLVTPVARIYGALFGIADAVQTGMSHAYWLVNLDARFHPLADEAFRRIEELVTPTGFTDEAIVTDDYSHLQFIREPFGFVSDVSARFRSWESGIVGHALLFHLAGYEPDVATGRARFAPHLPPEWDHVAFRRLAFGDGRFDLEVRRDGAGGRRILLDTDDRAVFELALTVPLDGAFVSATIDGREAGAVAETNRYGRTVVRFPPLAVPPSARTEIHVATAR